MVARKPAHPASLHFKITRRFWDEDVAYSERLRAAGVPCEFYKVDGAFHGFDVMAASANVSREFWASVGRAMAKALNVGYNENASG